MAELIELLKAFPEDLEVVIDSSSGSFPSAEIKDVGLEKKTKLGGGEDLRHVVLSSLGHE